jgi:uncharacterized alpha-E superfamily protein
MGVILDSVESVLKQEKFDKHQNKIIKDCLLKCKYSKLSYNQTELKPHKPRLYPSLATKSISKENEKTSRRDSINTLQTVKETPENEIEQTTYAEESKSVLSPSSFYLKFQVLSVEDKSYLDSQDKTRRLKFKAASQIAKKQFTDANNFFTSLNSLKEGQQALKEPFFINKKSEPKKQNTTEIEPKPELASDCCRTDETETAKVAQIETKLANLIQNLKDLLLKLETSEHKDSFDKSFRENIEKSIKSIETIKGQRPAASEAFLKQIEDNLTKMTKDYEQKLHEAETLKKLKQKELIDRLEKEEQDKNQKKKQFLNELHALKLKFNDLSKCLMKSIGILSEKKIAQHLSSQAKLLVGSFQTNAKEIASICLIIEDNSEMDDSQKFLDDLSASLAKFTKNKNDLATELKALIESSQESDDVQTRQQKEQTEAAQKLKETADLKLAQEKALVANKNAAQKQLVQKINDTDKNGVNQLTFKNYEMLSKNFEKLRTEVDASLSAVALKLHKFDLQKAINFPLNSLLEDDSNEENRRNFNDKIKTLLRLLSGHTCDITTTLRVAPSKHPRSIDFCLIYLSRKLVEKG